VIAVRPTRWLGAMAADVVAVLVFAVAGRNAHDESSGAGTVVTIAAPFLIGLLVGWIVSWRAGYEPAAPRTGLVVWVATVVVGLALRRTVWDRGVALSFVIVTALVLGALLVGWRALWVFAHRHGGLESTSPPSKAER
jgi:drug/metabolite transporter (DMT)-like permease